MVTRRTMVNYWYRRICHNCLEKTYDVKINIDPDFLAYINSLVGSDSSSTGKFNIACANSKCRGKATLVESKRPSYRKTRPTLRYIVHNREFEVVFDGSTESLW